MQVSLGFDIATESLFNFTEPADFIMLIRSFFFFLVNGINVFEKLFFDERTEGALWQHWIIVF